MKMILNAVAHGKHFIKTQPLSVNYGTDGLLVLGAMSIAANNNNLFATRLGATPDQLAMLHFFPSLLALILLIPAGIFADSLRNKRRMITVSLFMAAAFFLVVSGSAFVPVHTVYFFLVFSAFAAVSVNGFYNLAWQAFFPEAVPEEGRNTVLTFRARMTMLVQMVVPLAIGAILLAVPSEGGKIHTHQLFYVCAALLLGANAIYFKKIKALRPAAPKRVSFAEMKTAAGRLLGNKQFIVFTLVILFFHMMWQMDWTMYFVGQQQYLEMNELLLSLTPAGGMVAQLLTLKFWSKRSAKQGPDKPLTYGILGLALNPIAMIVGVSIGGGAGTVVFLVIHFIATLAFANVALNLFQCLLKVVDDEYRSFSISIYSCLMMLSNAIMPRVGVVLYNGLGADLNGLRMMFAVAFVLRLVATGLWVLRVRYFRAYEKKANKNKSLSAN